MVGLILTANFHRNYYLYIGPVLTLSLLIGCTEVHAPSSVTFCGNFIEHSKGLLCDFFLINNFAACWYWSLSPIVTIFFVIYESNDKTTHFSILINPSRLRYLYKVHSFLSLDNTLHFVVHFDEYRKVQAERLSL